MPWRRPSLAYLIAFVSSLVVAAALPSRAGSILDGGWSIEEGVASDPATWAAYYRRQAHVRLGPEQRLPNGVSWRLHEDVDTKLALPRITWMPDAPSQRTANGLLEMVRG